MIEVREVGSTDGGWDEYLRRHDGALVYASTRFRGFLCELLGCRDRSLAAFEGGRIVGVLPALELVHPGGTILNSLPYYGSNGGVLANDGDAAALLASRFEGLASAAASATVVENPFVAESLPELRTTHTDERIAQWSALPASGVESSARRNARKARDAGYTVREDPAALRTLHALHDAGMNAIGGRAKDRRFFDLVGAMLEPQRDFDLFVAERDGDVQAGLLVLYFHRTAEYYVPATDPAWRALQPLALVLERALTVAAERGFTRWNWGGTWHSQKGVHRFKRKWGAADVPYRYRTQVNDSSLLSATPDELVRHYPGFYVVPFEALARA